MKYGNQENSHLHGNKEWYLLQSLGKTTQFQQIRPIALTSNICKVMEKMVMSRVLFYLETRNLIHPYQSGFRKGRSTLDAVVCLENEIRKAHVNKEAVKGVFFYIEKAYNMVWKEGLLIKLDRMSIKWRNNWVMDFLQERTIQVRV